MNFLELVKARHSVRGYEQRAVEQEKLDYILECAPFSFGGELSALAVCRGDRTRQACCAEECLCARMDSKCAVHHRCLWKSCRGMASQVRWQRPYGCGCVNRRRASVPCRCRAGIGHMLGMQFRYRPLP